MEHLKYLELYDVRGLQYLAPFTAKLTNLVEADIEFEHLRNVEEISAFLQNHPNLMKVHFYSEQHTFHEDVLRERLVPLANEWDIEVFNVRAPVPYFVLRRKV